MVILYWIGIILMTSGVAMLSGPGAALIALGVGSMGGSVIYTLREKD